MERHAVIVGGGIGGLTAAIGLRKVGWRVTVLERSAGPAEVGAGISLWPNALHALAALGVRLEPLLTNPMAGSVRDLRGRVLNHLDSEQLAGRFGYPMVGVHRADLLRLLWAELPADALRTGVQVTGVGPAGEVSTPDSGDIEPADLVVGADGIGSVVRAARWPAHPGPASCGVTAFRAVIDPPDGVRFGTTWGPGTEVGILPLAGDRLYWFASMVGMDGVRPADPRAFLLDRLRGWPADVRAVIEATEPGRILHNDVLVLPKPPRSYVAGRVALLGDAAHAMTPFLGQGGCQAIEDGVVLASAISRFGTVPEALAHYDRERVPRTTALARASDLAGRAGHRLRHPVAVRLRDTAVRLAPASLAVRQLRPALDWRPPRISAS